MGVLNYPDPIDDNYLPNILQEIYTNKLYDPFLKGKKDLTILDLGSNIGLTAMYFAKYAKTVYCFEPAEENFKMLQKNIKDNEVQNVKLYQVAISHKEGEVTFYNNKNKTAGTLTPFAMNKTGEEKVKTITLDKFIEQEKIDHIDLLKCDIEGAEPEVLCSESFRKIADKVDTLIYEYHSWSQRVPIQINNCLKDLGFYVYQLPAEAVVYACVKVKP